MPPTDVDVAIVGAGAAGLATALFVLQQHPAARVALLDGARHPGAKILVSGGSRCNVTNRVVTESDFNGGRPGPIRRILRAFPAAATVALFEALGVRLHEEAEGKLFPDSNRARDVLDALLAALRDRSTFVRALHRVERVEAVEGGFVLGTSAGSLSARCAVLATGGLSLPKTGSDGFGYELARRLGHAIVPTTPALAPLVLAGAGHGSAMHERLSGVAQNVRLEIRGDRRIITRIHGSMLWTHFGVSGPAALDASRHFLRARLEGHAPTVTANLAPALTFDALEDRWISIARRQPGLSVQTVLGSIVPSSVAAALGEEIGIAPQHVLADLTREDRRRLNHALLECPLPVRDSRGYSYAEVTAGGVELSEVNPASMESRRCPRLFLVGEILDVDGRLGGFNFQWAWSSASVAAVAIAASLRSGAPQDH